jgi:hypothetical protein
MSGHASWARLLGADPVPGLLACGARRPLGDPYLRQPAG